MLTFKEQLNESMKLNKDHTVTHDSESAEFAKSYIKGLRGEYREGGPSAADEKHAANFHNTWNAKRMKTGFAGSGTTLYTHNETGKQFEVNKQATGDGFYNTNHHINKVDNSIARN